MLRTTFAILFLVLSNAVLAQSNLNYTMTLTAVGKVEIEITGVMIKPNNARFIIPRSAPGTYELTDYSLFIENITAFTVSGKKVIGSKGLGSYFMFQTDEQLMSLRYEVDLNNMEESLLGSFASSKFRTAYAGILGYSVFGFWDGYEDFAVQLTIESQASWPMFTTHNPVAGLQHGLIELDIENYALLADAQYLFGSDLKIREVRNKTIPLFVAVYAETDTDMDEVSRRANKTLESLESYFGFVPMPHYTFCLEYFIPKSEKHDYGFSMEHMNSMTASMDTSKAIQEYNPNANIGSWVHHMAHSWIPLRAYGVGYRPFEWQSAPIIETIWLNEGFIWYVMTQALNQPQRMNYFRRVVNNAPEFISKKSMKELSGLGSTQYSSDFDIGRNLFSRGALMAAEMDEFIRSTTNDEKTFRDALLGLMTWTEENQRGFTYDEIEPILSKASNTDLGEIWHKWQSPIENE